MRLGVRHVFQQGRITTAHCRDGKTDVHGKAKEAKSTKPELEYTRNSEMFPTQDSRDFTRQSPRKPLQKCGETAGGMARNTSRRDQQEEPKKGLDAMLGWISRVKIKVKARIKGYETNLSYLEGRSSKSLKTKHTPSDVPSSATLNPKEYSVTASRGKTRRFRWLPILHSSKKWDQDRAVQSLLLNHPHKPLNSAINAEWKSTFEENIPLSCNTERFSLIGPQPFQCTFCLLQYTSKGEWLEHEFFSHYRGQEWDCTARISMPQKLGNPAFVSGKDSNNRPSKGQAHGSCYTNANETKSRNVSLQEDWFWNCGFCDNVLRSWTDRQDHIYDEHYGKGATMRFWDPVKSPYPWKRGSITPVPSGAECWDLTALQAVQQPTLIDFIRMTGDSQLPKTCKVCQLPTGNLEASIKHTNLWHGGRIGWSCSRLANEGLEDRFFDSYFGQNGTIADVCLCCGETLRHNGPDDDTRVEHLREEHKIYEGSCRHTCYSKEQFYLHLAHRHNLHLDYVKDVMRYCKREPRAVALMTMI